MKVKTVGQAVLIDFLRESNAIEGVYDDVSLKDALKAWKYIIAHDKLTPTIVKHTHAILMRMQPIPRSLKGHFRDCDVYIGDRMGLSWPIVPLKIKEWCDFASKTPAYVRGTNDIERIKQDHIDYEHIHPFVDGNGRTGRIFYNWQRVKAGLPIHVIWKKDVRSYYEWF